MSLINPPAQPPEATPLSAIRIQNSFCLQVMIATAKNVYDLVWNNPDYTPQQVCDLMGTDAVKAFDAHSALQTLIYAVDNSYVPLVPSVSYVKNQDGTVSIGL